VAAPVDAYVRPAEPARSNLWQVAEALSGLDRNLGQFVAERKAQADETDRIRGEAAFYQKNEAGFAEGVREGSIPTFAAPAFMNGYKNAQGAVTGMKLAQEFQIAYMNWPGKNGTDPAAYDTFLQGFIAEKTKGVTDPQVLKGMLPHIRSLSQGMQGVFMRDLDRNIYDGTLKTNAAGVSQIIQQADTDGRGRPTGTDYEGVWGSILKTRSAALASGLRTEDYDDILVKTIVGEALENRDPGLLKLLDKTLPGTTYKISDTPAGREAKERGMHQLEVLGRQALADDDRETIRRDKAAKAEAERSAIDVILANPNGAIPEAILKAGARYDPDFKVKVMGWQKTIRENTVVEDPEALATLHADIFAGGGMDAIKKALTNGTLRTAESIRTATGYAKSLEEGGAKGPLKGPTFLGVMAAIRDRTRDGKLVNPLDPNSGLSDAGLEGQVTYQRLLMEWRAKNPDASELDILKAQQDIGKSVLDNISGGGIDQPKVFREPGSAQPAPAPATQPAAPQKSQAAPQASPDWASTIKALPGEDTAAAAGRGRWLKTLPPDSLKKIEDAAARLGITPAEQSRNVWQKLRDKRAAVEGGDQSSAYAAAAQGISDVIGSFIQPAEAAVTPTPDQRSLGAYRERAKGEVVSNGADLKNISPKARSMLDGILKDNPGPLRVSSGFRDAGRNAKAGGARHSQHIGGHAIDIDISGLSDEQKRRVLASAIKNGAKGIGIYPSGDSLHVDVRSTPAFWGPNPRGAYRGAPIASAPSWARGELSTLFGGSGKVATR